MRAGRAVVIGAALMLAAAGQGGAQDLPAQTVPGLVVLDLDRLFQESDLGKELIAASEAANRAMIAENQKIEAQLEAEERDLAARRATMPAADFRALAKAFDEKVVSIRAARDRKVTEATAKLEADKRHFLETAYPLLEELLKKRGALAVIDRRAVILGVENIDITDQAIETLNQNPPAAPAP